MDTHPYRATGERIVTTTPFGDVDCGPTHGIRVDVRFNEADDIVNEVAIDVWRYFTTNYQDAWQEYRVVSATPSLLVLDLYTTWGDGHRSAVPAEPHRHEYWTTGGAWRCDCGATKPRLIGPGV